MLVLFYVVLLPEQHELWAIAKFRHSFFGVNRVRALEQPGGWKWDQVQEERGIDLPEWAVEKISP